MRQILIGADPEVFVKDKAGNHISAFGMVDGTKEKPFKVDKGAVQVDGMALEFNIDPASTSEEFVDNIFSVMGTLQGMIKDEIDIKPVAHFTEEYMKSQPKEAKELGCEPDYNVWTGKVNPTPDGAKLFRTAAGHIHIGWTEDQDVECPIHRKECEFIVKALDRALYGWSPMWDTDEKRRELYGKEGSYRPKSYGVEYRVLSNAWLRHPSIAKFVYALATEVLDQAFKGDLLRIGQRDQTAAGKGFRDVDCYETFKTYIRHTGLVPNKKLYKAFVECKEFVLNEE